jgi:hypothetical protein
VRSVVPAWRSIPSPAEFEGVGAVAVAIEGRGFGPAPRRKGSGTSVRRRRFGRNTFMRNGPLIPVLSTIPPLGAGMSGLPERMSAPLRGCREEGKKPTTDPGGTMTQDRGASWRPRSNLMVGS